MAYPITKGLGQCPVTTYSPSIGGTPVAAYLRIPFRCQLVELGVTANGAITTADAAIAVAIDGGSADTALAFTLPVASAAAGQIAKRDPGRVVNLTEGQVLSFTPSGASGSNISGNFFALLRAN